MDSKALTLNVLSTEASPTSLLTRDVLCQRSNGGIKRLESQLRLITMFTKKVSDLYDSYMDVKKEKSRKSVGAVNQRNSFEDFLVQKARDSLEYIESPLESDSDIFRHRSDYKSLAMLVRVYLTGDTHGFKFSLPIKTSHARFLQRGLYYLTGDLLSYQLDFLTDEDFQEISHISNQACHQIHPSMIWTSLMT